MKAASTSAKKQRRPVGRPRGRDSNLRDRLIDAAIAQFARRGIGATSVSAIAQAAGVTPAMLHYYFGDKQQMTLAMLEERLLPAIAPLRVRIEAAGDDSGEIARAFVNGVTKVVSAHPWLPPLWVREVLCEGGTLREAMFQRAIPQLPQLLARRFEAAQARGRLSTDLDPRLMVVSLVGLTLFPAAGAPVWQGLFDAKGLDMEALRKHALALLDHGMGTHLRNRKKKSP